MDAENELETLRRLVKNTAAHLRCFKELDSELTEFCSYADSINDEYYTDGEFDVKSADEDDEDDGVDGAPILED